ncbi:hypothetical protein [Falsiroseomonas sp. HW251]|uniref:hypothetical protein n=1 Tax=Falsiroseomonas sp. HW251 TaxID=3390998 RepID=UPI003D312788
MNLWVWRIFLLIAVPSLAVVGMSIGSQLPHALATRSDDLPGLLGWAAALATGVLMVVASVVLRYRGRTGTAAFLAGIVAMPAAVGISIFALIVLLFILKGM